MKYSAANTATPVGLCFSCSARTESEAVAHMPPKFATAKVRHCVLLAGWQHLLRSYSHAGYNDSPIIHNCTR